MILIIIVIRDAPEKTPLNDSPHHLISITNPNQFENNLRKSFLKEMTTKQSPPELDYWESELIKFKVTSRKPGKAMTTDNAMSQWKEVKLIIISRITSKFKKTFET